MKKLLTGLTVATLLLFVGCAKMQNEIARDGGFFGSYAADYIVRNDSGGKIMDMWKLRNVIVQEEEHGAGWLFRDNAGNPINIGGDVKVVRCINLQDWDRYHEYHAEFETKSYQELYSQKEEK